jgi:plasmid maintenance system antidote protein VapI
MKLATYLHENDIKPVAFAAMLDVAPSTITRILRGERTPRIDLILKIKSATDGKVTADDWMEPASESAA